ncbi:MAG: hypothetical protein KTR14_08145 [Vampirovibrio sp.]|nr:hypothetical protein [Vampirovibrio sp.]
MGRDNLQISGIGQRRPVVEVRKPLAGRGLGAVVAAALKADTESTHDLSSVFGSVWGDSPIILANNDETGSVIPGASGDRPLIEHQDTDITYDIAAEKLRELVRQQPGYLLGNSFFDVLHTDYDSLDSFREEKAFFIAAGGDDGVISQAEFDKFVEKLETLDTEELKAWADEVYASLGYKTDKNVSEANRQIEAVTEYLDAYETLYRKATEDTPVQMDEVSDLLAQGERLYSGGPLTESEIDEIGGLLEAAEQKFKMADDVKEAHQAVKSDTEWTIRLLPEGEQAGFTAQKSPFDSLDDVNQKVDEVRTNYRDLKERWELADNPEMAEYVEDVLQRLDSAGAKELATLMDEMSEKRAQWTGIALDKAAGKLRQRVNAVSKEMVESALDVAAAQDYKVDVWKEKNPDTGRVEPNLYVDYSSRQRQYVGYDAVGKILRELPGAKGDPEALAELLGFERDAFVISDDLQAFFDDVNTRLKTDDPEVLADLLDEVDQAREADEWWAKYSDLDETVVKAANAKALEMVDTALKDKGAQHYSIKSEVQKFAEGNFSPYIEISYDRDEDGTDESSGYSRNEKVSDILRNLDDHDDTQDSLGHFLELPTEVFGEKAAEGHFNRKAWEAGDVDSAAAKAIWEKFSDKFDNNYEWGVYANLKKDYGYINHITETAAMILDLDTDKDGHLTVEEIQAANDRVKDQNQAGLEDMIKQAEQTYKKLAGEDAETLLPVENRRPVYIHVKKDDEKGWYDPEEQLQYNFIRKSLWHSEGQSNWFAFENKVEAIGKDFAGVDPEEVTVRLANKFNDDAITPEEFEGFYALVTSGDDAALDAAIKAEYKALADGATTPSETIETYSAKIRGALANDPSAGELMNMMDTINFKVYEDYEVDLKQLDDEVTQAANAKAKEMLDKALEGFGVKDVEIDTGIDYDSYSRNVAPFMTVTSPEGSHKLEWRKVFEILRNPEDHTGDVDALTAFLDLPDGVLEAKASDDGSSGSDEAPAGSDRTEGTDDRAESDKGGGFGGAGTFMLLAGLMTLPLLFKKKNKKSEFTQTTSVPPWAAAEERILSQVNGYDYGFNGGFNNPFTGQYYSPFYYDEDWA